MRLNAIFPDGDKLCEDFCKFSAESAQISVLAA